VLAYLERLVMLDRVSKLQRLDDAARQVHVDGYRALLSALLEDCFESEISSSRRTRNAQPSPSTFIGSARWRSGMLWPAQQSEVRQKPCPGVDETT
jgi:hypothetical protein